MRKAFPYALRASLPVLTGYLAAGFAFGLMFQQAGYGILMTAISVITVYSGALQFVAVDLLSSGAGYVQIALVGFMVNCRHLLYGISLARRFEKLDARKWYIAYALTDETYALLTVTLPPAGVNESALYFLIALLNEGYWLMGCLAGNIAGQLISLNFAGVEFAMTALFIVTFVEQWKTASSHIPALLGLGCTLVALILFGQANMLIPAMIAIIALLLALRGKIEAKEDAPCD